MQEINNVNLRQRKCDAYPPPQLLANCSPVWCDVRAGWTDNGGMQETRFNYDKGNKNFFF